MGNCDMPPTWLWRQVEHGVVGMKVEVRRGRRFPCHWEIVRVDVRINGWIRECGRVVWERIILKYAKFSDCHLRDDGERGGLEGPNDVFEFSFGEWADGSTCFEFVM